jgi:very-short-patch-repair endonuclease
MPVTTMHRTVVDLAGSLDRDRLAALVDEAVLRRTTTLRWIRQTVDRLGGRGRAGTKLLKEVLEERSDDAVPNGRLERRFIGLLNQERIRRPIKQFPLRLPNGRIRHYDFAYPPNRLVIETDGYRFHRLKDNWQRDLDDSNQLSEIGWRLLRFSWEDVTERSDYVIAAVKKALSGTDPQQQLPFRSSHHPESGHHDDQNAKGGRMD